MLGFEGNPSCLRSQSTQFTRAPQIGHVFRKAAADLSLEAVYVIHPRPGNLESSTTAAIPALYVCDVASEQEAEDVHRKVWNQDATPFVLVNSPAGLRLYSGFQHRRKKSGEIEGSLSPLLSLDEAAAALRDFNAVSLSVGTTWRKRAGDVRWQHRLNRQLLDNLLRLDRVLQEDGVDETLSHALIGKFVYFRYLRDRNILSDRKLARWKIKPEAVFGSHARIDAVAEVNRQLDAWLNGSVFPLSFSGKQRPTAKHLRLVSGVFSGDRVEADGSVQLSLDFDSYDFSFIPIETLSLVYEQFLHKGKKGGARDQGAYYTPIPVVNLMLAELAESRPLKRGMTVIDPACGSGAFLVQAYRQLIEREFPAGTRPKPGDLGELLERSIHGIDVDADACNVTELSLVLTLLDYLDPPDLEDRRRGFKLPTLRGKNVFHANFFDPLPEPVRKKAESNGFDWVVGNPPWKQLNQKKLTESDQAVWEWMENHKEYPIGSHQMARAFLWKSSEILNRSEGMSALFIPGMTLYDNPSSEFRKRFFAEFKVSTVVDFSNMAAVLAPKRFQYASAAVFFSPRTEGDRSTCETITFYPPKIANQELTRPPQKGARTESWELVINGNELREVSAREAATGDGLVWKLAMWGSQMDARLLRRLEGKFPSLMDLVRDRQAQVAQGLEFRESASGEETVEVDVPSWETINIKTLERIRDLYVIPQNSTFEQPTSKRGVRKRSGMKGLKVSRPPHVIVSAARNFAIYSEEFLIVPPRQIGIVSPDDNKDFLKALSLFLSSDFALYHQFLRATEFGIKRPRANLETLRKIPIPFRPDDDLGEWVELHTKLIAEQTRTHPGEQSDFFDEGEALNFSSKEFHTLLWQLNRLTARALGLTKQEESLIHDLIQVRFGMLEGRIEDRAVKPPTKSELLAYARTVKSDLDGFLGPEAKHSHEVTILTGDDGTAVVAIEYSKAPRGKTEATVETANSRTARTLQTIADELVTERAQWVYFNRNFRIHEGNRTFFFKPLQRIHWTRTQAALDAQAMIAEILASEKG